MRFSGRLTGWASTKASDGTVLLEEVGGGGNDDLGSYKAIVNGLTRQGFEMSTKKVGTLKKGSVIEALETRVNDKGVTRVRFDNGTIAGWVSTKAGDGSVLLEKQGSVTPADNDGPPGRTIWYADEDDEEQV